MFDLFQATENANDFLRAKKGFEGGRRAVFGAFPVMGRIEDVYTGTLEGPGIRSISQMSPRVGAATQQKTDGSTVGFGVLVETRRIELPTFALRTRRSPS